MDPNLADTQSMPPAIKKGDVKYLAVISLAYTALNLSISLVLFRDLYPMSIYPASIAFIIVHVYVKERLPVKKVIGLFLCIYQAIIVIGCVAMAMQNGLAAIDFSKFLEPLLFLPLVVIIFLLSSALGHRKVIPRMNLVCGFVFVAIAVVSLIPGNPVFVFMSNHNDDYNLIDANVPAALVIGVYLWYHVPFVMGLAGCVAFIIGYITLYTKKKIDNIIFMMAIIGIVFSIYVIGVAFTWILLRQPQERITT